MELRRISNRWLIIASLIILIAPTTILALVNFSNQQPFWSFTTYGSANSVALSSDGSNVALGIATQCCGPSRSGQILLLDRTGRTLWSFGTNSAINSVDISPDGSHIAQQDIYQEHQSTITRLTVQYTISTIAGTNFGLALSKRMGAQVVWNFGLSRSESPLTDLESLSTKA